MRDFRQLAIEIGARDDLLQEIGRLCGGKHPAIEILDRARNKLGFHSKKALEAVSDAMDTLIDFCTAVVYGYMRRIGGERYEAASQ